MPGPVPPGDRGIPVRTIKGAVLLRLRRMAPHGHLPESGRTQDKDRLSGAAGAPFDSPPPISDTRRGEEPDHPCCDRSVRGRSGKFGSVKQPGSEQCTPRMRPRIRRMPEELSYRQGDMRRGCNSRPTRGIACRGVIGSGVSSPLPLEIPSPSPWCDIPDTRQQKMGSVS